MRGEREKENDIQPRSLAGLILGILRFLVGYQGTLEVFIICLYAN